MTKVPMNYLAKVLQLLARSEIVTGRRGVGGGYRLSRPASEVSMLDVINAIDPMVACHPADRPDGSTVVVI